MSQTVFERAKLGGAIRCTEEEYFAALGAVPPKEYLSHGFVMGEQYDTYRWYAFWKFDGQFWCMLTFPSDYRGVRHISDNGITYGFPTCSEDGLPPQSTPWGEVQHTTRLGDGIWFVSTASHGGIWLREDRVKQLCERGVPAYYRPFTGSLQWWEEDCDWCIPTLIFAAEIDTDATSAKLQLEGMARSMRGQYQRAWESLCC